MQRTVRSIAHCRAKPGGSDVLHYIDGASDVTDSANHIMLSLFVGSGAVEAIWKVAGWIVSVAALCFGIVTVVSERKYAGYGNSLVFSAGFIVLGLAVNPIVLRSVKLFGRASFTVLAGVIIAVALVCYASWYAP